ncbi:hypothetical protein Tco_0889705 [Tanacetum coccineum]
MSDDTPMCERHEANYIQYEDNKDRNSHDSHSYQSHHDPNDSKKWLLELNNDVRNNLEDFKRCNRSMRTVHWKLFARDDGTCRGRIRKDMELKSTLEDIRSSNGTKPSIYTQRKAS